VKDAGSRDLAISGLALRAAGLTSPEAVLWATHEQLARLHQRRLDVLAASRS
jgi:hypothetical protein